jgi:dTDP-4-amino-4,6-dideoxygalactose transaminase
LDSYIDARRKAADYYDKAFAGVEEITTPYRDPKTKHVFHQYTLKLNDSVDRDGMVEFLKEKDIPAMIYYPVPAHKQKMFNDLDTEVRDLTTTDWLTSRVISLPMHTELENEHLEYITGAVIEYIQS